MVRSKHESNLCELMLRTLDLVWSWCQSWSKYKYKPWQDNISAIRQKEEVQDGFMALGRTATNYVKEVKYLSVILDRSILGLPR